MKNIIFLGTLLICLTARSQNTELVYRDPITKLAWMKKLTGLYLNGCVNSLGGFDNSKCTSVNGLVKVEDSDAAMACKRIGARLPTISEFSNLIRNFDHTEDRSGPMLTQIGTAKVQEIFGDMNNWFWTSSVSSYLAGNAYLYYGLGGISDVSRYGNSHHFVRCVLD